MFVAGSAAGKIVVLRGARRWTFAGELNRPFGGYDDFVIRWAPDPRGGRVWGRPAGLLVLPGGSLLISDDGAGVIWRIR